MVDKMINNLVEKYGKSLDEWIKIVHASKLEKHGQIVKYLKDEFGFTHGYANLLSHKARQSDAGSTDANELISNQYAGPKLALKPIYDELVKGISAFGADVEFAPKKAYVSVRRKKQFAIIQPSTKTRLDIGINIKGSESTDRLEKSGSFNSMVSHRVRITDPSQIDDEIFGWLKSAYELAG
jgi:predicted transport protein